jgi:FkbM family methyltransferase
MLPGTVEDVVARAVPHVEALEQLARPIAAHGWRAYVDLPDSGTAPIGNLLRVKGWVTSCDPSCEPSVVTLLREDGSQIARVPRIVERPDVAAAVTGAATHAGFDFEIDLAGAGPVVTISADEVPLARVHLYAGEGSDGSLPTSLPPSSQRGEDAVLRYLLPANAPRFLFDVGAHDGSHLSNSAPFISHGWAGVLVEPSPVPFAALSMKYADNDLAHCVQAACSDHVGTETLFFGSDDEGGTNATLCTDNNEWFAATRSSRTIEVPVTTLNDLCTYYHAPEVFGLLLVDAEGMDLEVLRGLNPQRHRPLVVCTERYMLRPDKEQAKAQLLRSWGLLYHGAVGWNDLWVDPTISQF